MRAKPMLLMASFFLIGLCGRGVYAAVTDVTVDGAKRYQTMEGFGTCLIAWTERFRNLYRTEEFQKIYVEGVGCNMLRVNMWGPTFEKPTEDWTKISSADFDMNADGGRPQIFVDFGRSIRKLNPDLKIIGTVWSPPAWMKVNKSITDKKSSAIRAGGYGANSNRVDPKYFQHFCKWMVSANSSRQFWDLIQDTGKPFWITEGGTGNHDWPAPIEKGIGNALHNALVAGNCSAFVPWQITEGNKSIHALMVMSTYTPKTYTAMHYTRFIRPGAQRIDAQPAFGTVQVGAFLHEKDGDLAIVAVNPPDQDQVLNLVFRSLGGLALLKVYRTSASESLKEVDEVAVRDNKAAFKMTPQSIVTLSGKVGKP